MAVEPSHAAWRTTYEVRESAGALDLGPRHVCDDYLEAVEFALDYLAEQDPERSGAVEALRVDRVRGEARQTMWTYESSEADAPVVDLQQRWGFDVTRRWRGPAHRAA